MCADGPADVDSTEHGETNEIPAADGGNTPSRGWRKVIPGMRAAKSLFDTAKKVLPGKKAFDIAMRAVPRRRRTVENKQGKDEQKAGKEANEEMAKAGAGQKVDETTGESKKAEDPKIEEAAKNEVAAKVTCDEKRKAAEKKKAKKTDETAAAAQTASKKKRDAEGKKKAA